MRSTGVRQIILATGDRRDVATAVAANLPFDAIRSELTPDQKVLVVIAERKHGPVMMIGDGVNDAPALAAADLGVAMGARGTAASAEAADVVLLVDQVDRVLPGIRIARRAAPDRPGKRIRWHRPILRRDDCRCFRDHNTCPRCHLAGNNRCYRDFKRPTRTSGYAH